MAMYPSSLNTAFPLVGERLNFIRQIFGVGQVVAVSLGVKNGLGRRIQSLSNRELADLEKV